MSGSSDDATVQVGPVTVGLRGSKWILRQLVGKRKLTGIVTEPGAGEAIRAREGVKAAWEGFQRQNPLRPMQSTPGSGVDALFVSKLIPPR